MNTQEFISKSVIVHNSKYDYSKTNYINAKTKVCIICPEHGEFWQLPYSHLNGHGCPKCNRKNDLKSTFINKAKELYGDKYDFTNISYNGCEIPVEVMCPKHGLFKKTPHDILQGKACPCCEKIDKVSKYEKKIFSTQDFINASIEKFGDIYDFSKTEYTGGHNKVCIICKTHGEFWVIPNHFLRGNGCPMCSKENVAKSKMLSKEEFIKKSQKIHGNKYDYSKVEYNGAYKKIKIICPEHGEFWQTPHNHLNGKGCPKCNESLLEKEVRKFLIENDLKFVSQYKLIESKNKCGYLRLDFFLPQLNIAIECQGLQHFEEEKKWGGANRLVEQKERDVKKNKLCFGKHIKILYFISEKAKKYIGNDIYKNNICATSIAELKRLIEINAKDI